MCFIADDIVKCNFCDIAVHDARILRRMNPGETRLWIVSELGSQFLPMYCRLSEKARQKVCDYALSSVEVTLARLVSHEPFAKIQQQQFFKTAKFFLVTKTADACGGFLVPIDFRDIVHVVFRGELDELVD